MITQEYTAGLVLRASHGDVQAFGELYSQLWRDLYRFAFYSLNNKQDAEDAVQDAIVSAWRNIGKIKNAEAFKAYMFKILSNCCKGQYKLYKKQNATPLDDIDDFLSDSDSENSKRAFELWESLKSLNDTERMIISLSITSGYKSDEIAVILHKNASTVRSVLSRALKKLESYDLCN